MPDIQHLIELPGVYDGWSISVHTDGSFHNRWADDSGDPVPGYERRWKATEDAIRGLRERAARDPRWSNEPGE